MNTARKILGINGFGRIGKLTLWQNISRKYFDEIIINIGRKSGTSMDDIAHYAERDSTYGRLESFLYGCSATPVITEIDESDSSMVVDGLKIRFMRKERDPKEIRWDKAGARLVVDTTGQFLDPTKPEDEPKGSVRGHIKAGAEKVIVSAPFKIKDKGLEMPEDAVTTVMGINENDYNPRKHNIISNASCTTTCLAHMIKPLINHFGAGKILSASMSTVHAATGSQEVLDRLPKSGATDLRKSRSVMNNIILTSTGAAKALGLVIPEMNKIGFIAESVRIPITTGSLIILVINFQDDVEDGSIRRELINEIYRRTSENDINNYLLFTEKQNVSCDIIGVPKAATVIEGSETHTRTATVSIDLGSVPGIDSKVAESFKDLHINAPVTQAVIYGWYDNEMGSYTNMLCDRIISIAETM